jgi:hypothetical protein
MNKVTELEKGMIELVTKTETVIEQMSIACAEELAKEKSEKEKLQSAFLTAEADVKLITNMQTQVYFPFNLIILYSYRSLKCNLCMRP